MSSTPTLELSVDPVGFVLVPTRNHYRVKHENLTQKQRISGLCEAPPQDTGGACENEVASGEYRGRDSVDYIRAPRLGAGLVEEGEVAVAGESHNGARLELRSAAVGRPDDRLGRSGGEVTGGGEPGTGRVAGNEGGSASDVRVALSPDGELPSSSGSTKLVAVKRLDRLGKRIDDDSEKEFTNEVRSIGQMHHKNLVKLIGYCHEESQRLLVYEYMSRGSLQEFLFGGERPPWEQRASIAMGIARGLMYLHEECSVPIIHCDIKPKNVLLDDNLVARIADFGLAKLLRTDQTRTNTGIRGTKGYVAPEWFKSMAITKKVDVYSFGVMLLEIVSCRRNLETETETEEVAEDAVLVYWAYDCYRVGRLDLLLRDGEDDRERMERFVTVAIWCIQEDPGLRPSISAVVRMLEGGVPVAVPPDPSTDIQSLRQ
ncbi:hypothetical protein ZIOFF_020382 [Zingiber officinale]|uniref:Protein kinase domain-containing protein n=1 Tax=Zingiber officinale TaxID=94328 RepID=A0A8J5H680_ZINOF|nr:hypothetical protein ZIOFF_020382 [Zingiber officinale]